LSKYAAIHEFDQGMDRRLWMHNDLHAFRGQVEQAAGFDYSNPLFIKVAESMVILLPIFQVG